MKIDVGPYTYEVVEDTNLLDELSGEEQEDGHWHAPSQRLVLRERLAVAKRRVVLFHEVGHAVLEIGGLSDHKDAEKFLRQTDAIWVDTIRRNPHLRSYLFEA